MSDSLNGYIDKLLKEMTELQKSVSELRRDNRELRDMITNSHHQWWKTARDKDDVDMVEDMAYINPEYIKDQ